MRDIGCAIHAYLNWTISSSTSVGGATSGLIAALPPAIDDEPPQLAGNHQVLTPNVRVGGGLLQAPERGSLTSNWIGARWLNNLDTFAAPAMP